MEPGVGAVRGVDVAAVVDLDVVGLDRHLAALGGARADAALVGLVGGGGDVIADFLRVERIADVERADAGVEVREEQDAVLVDRRHVLAGGMRAETAAAAAEAAALFRHRPGGNTEWL